MKVFALELEYVDVLDDVHYELRGLFNSYDDAVWHWKFHVSDLDKRIFKNRKISKWDLED